MNRVTIHGAVRGRESLTRLVARLDTLTVAFGSALDDTHAIFRAATTAATRHTLSELRVRTDRSANSSVAMTTVSLVAQRQTGAVASRASVCAVSEVKVGENAAQFVSQLGFRFDYGFRRVGVCGVAYAGQLKLSVALFQTLSLAGDLLPPSAGVVNNSADVDDGADADDTEVWLLELETIAPARFVPDAIDAMYHWAARLYPIVEMGTIDTQAFSAARQQLVNFRVQLAALENAPPTTQAGGAVAQ